jgi:hypothetical protein
MTLTEARKLIAIGQQWEGSFGSSVGLSNGVAIVGEPSRDEFAINSGAAYLFDVQSGAQLNKLVSSNATTFDDFGAAVSIGDSVALITGSRSGTRLYDRITGTEKGTLFDQNARSAIDGEIAVLGRSRFAATFDVNSRLRIAELLPDNEVKDDSFFGASVDIHGNKVVVGATRAGTDLAGRVYVYDATTGGLISKLFPPPEDINIHLGFGTSVGIFDDTVVVSSFRSAYLYDAITGQLTYKLSPHPNEQMDFGGSVDIDEQLAVVNSPLNDTTGVDSGAVYVFDTVSAVLLKKLVASDPRPNDGFGHSVAIDGNTIIVGAPARLSGAGGAYVFVVPEPAVLVPLLHGLFWLEYTFRRCRIHSAR